MTNYETAFYRSPYKYTIAEPARDWLRESLEKRPLARRDKDLVKAGEGLASIKGYKKGAWG